MELTPQHLNQYPIRTNLLIRLTLGLGNPHNGDEGHEENFDYCRRRDADWIIGPQLCWFIGHLRVLRVQRRALR